MKSVFIPSDTRTPLLETCTQRNIRQKVHIYTKISVAVFFVIANNNKKKIDVGDGKESGYQLIG